MPLTNGKHVFLGQATGSLVFHKKSCWQWSALLAVWIGPASSLPSGSHTNSMVEKRHEGDAMLCC